MKRTITLTALAGILALALAACSSDPEPTATSEPTPQPTATTAPLGSQIDTESAIPSGAEVDRKAAMLLGIEVHRQIWGTRPSGNYKFGFQWNVGELAYQRANVEVRVLKDELDEVLWAENAVKTDGTEPEGFKLPDKPDDDDYYTIDGLFGVIQEAIESDPDRVTLGFDSVFGFPTSVVIEFLPNRDHEDVSFFAAQLVPIPGPPE